MKITVIPASTQAGKATIEALLKHESQSQIQAIYRDTSKAPAAFVDNGLFKAVQGGLDEGSNLDFGDSDAVFYIPPPTYDENVDSGDFATRGANKVKSALQKSSSVRRLVIFSALGAQHPDSIVGLEILQ